MRMRDGNGGEESEKFLSLSMSVSLFLALFLFANLYANPIRTLALAHPPSQSPSISLKMS